MQGFIVNDAEVAGITGTFVLGKRILLHEDSIADKYSKALPNSCYLSHLDIQVQNEGVATHDKCTVFLTWDADGNNPVTGLAQGLTLWEGLTGSAGIEYQATCIDLGVWVTRPAGQTTEGKIYMHIRGNAASPATFALRKARLHWATRATV